MNKSKLYFIFLLLLILLSLKSVIYAEYLTPNIWKTSKKTLICGRLIYKDFNLRISPGYKPTIRSSKEFLNEGLCDLRDTFLKSPETFKKIYNSGLVENFVDYKKMTSDNWNYSKLSLKDFYDAKEAYVQEGNWGIMQSLYYSIKGTSRVIWALGILNSGEALYKIGQAGVETTYYLLRYPVSSAFEFTFAPITFVGGTAITTGAVAITSGWALPLTPPIDAGIYMKEKLWEK